MKKILKILLDEGFKDQEYNCHSFDRTLLKGNLIFAVRNFPDRTELTKWRDYQDEINRNIFIKADPEKRLDIYFILFIPFKTTIEDISILHEIEKDPYYCRKIIIRDEAFEQDKCKMPFIPFNIQGKSAQENRAQTIKEFILAITKETSEQNIAEKIFDMKDSKEIARVLIDFYSTRSPKSEVKKTNL